MIKLDQYIIHINTRHMEACTSSNAGAATSADEVSWQHNRMHLTSSSIYSTIIKQHEMSPTYLSRKPAIHIHHHITDCWLPSLWLPSPTHNDPRRTGQNDTWHYCSLQFLALSSLAHISSSNFIKLFHSIPHHISAFMSGHITSLRALVHFVTCHIYPPPSEY